MKVKSETHSGSAVAPRLLGPAVRLFAIYTRFYLHRHFHSIRLLKSKVPTGYAAQPLVIYLNHASWWDPLVCIRLARTFFPARNSYAPIASESLHRYSYFKYLGFYGVNRQSMSGAHRFIRTTCSLLDSERNAVWLTPQGRFSDFRERPLRIQSGIGLLAKLAPDAVFLPLAIEYTFWTDSRPEILVSFGQARSPSKHRLDTGAQWMEFFRGELESEQDALAVAAQRRDPVDWIVLDRGSGSFGSIPDGWQPLWSEKSGPPVLTTRTRGESR